MYKKFFKEKSSKNAILNSLKKWIKSGEYNVEDSKEGFIVTLYKSSDLENLKTALSSFKTKSLDLKKDGYNKYIQYLVY